MKSYMVPHEVTEEELAPIREKMKYQSAQLFIEEPEQNLYPDAQRKLVQNIIRHLKAVKSVGKHRSMVVLTTHSPYVLSILNVLIADAAAVEKKPGDERLKDVVDEKYVASNMMLSRHISSTKMVYSRTSKIWRYRCSLV